MRRIAIIAAVIVALAATAVVLASIASVRDAVLSLASRSSEAGAAVFAIMFAVLVVAFVPQTVLALAAGFSYGAREGFAIAYVASFAAAWVGFWLGRGLLREQVARRARRDRRLATVDRNVRARGLLYVVLLRLSPVFPFAAINYLMSATAIRPWQYVVGSAIGLVPLTLLYVYVGSIAPVLHG